MTKLHLTTDFAKSPITRLLFAGLLLSVFSVELVAQCPQQQITLTSQTDVNAVPDSFPNCTEFEYTLWIEGSSANDPIIDLSPLSNLVTVRRLYLRIFETPDGTLSLEPLSGITSMDELYVDNFEGAASNFPDFSPLTNVQGTMCMIRFRDVGTDLSELSFPEITRLGSLEIRNCPETTALPTFDNIDYMGRLEIKDLPAMVSAELPPNLTSFGLQNNHCGVVASNAGLRVWNCPLLESVTCAAPPVRIGEMYFRENPLLTGVDISPIDSIHGNLTIMSPRPELFESFKDLRYTRHAEFFYELHPDYPPVDTLKVRAGEHSTEWSIGSPFISHAALNLWSDGPSAVEFTATVAPLIAGSLFLRGQALAGVSGLSNLDSLTGRLEIDMPAAAHLPDLTNLTYVRRHVYLAPGQSFTHLNEFGALRYVGQYLQLEGLPFLADISGLTALDTVGGRLSLIDLPSLESAGTAFSNLLFLNQLVVENTALTEFPGFDNLLEMSPSLILPNNPPRLTVMSNPDLTAIHTMPLLETYETLRVTNHPQLISFSISADAAYSGPLTLTENPLFSYCGAPGICNAAAQTDNISIFQNGTGCNSTQELDAACKWLGTDASAAETVEIYAEGNRLLHLRSHHPTGGDVHLFDLTGKPLAAHRLAPSTRHILPLPPGAAGILLVRYSTDAGVYTEKIFR